MGKFETVDEVVMVPVPKQHLASIYQSLACLMATGSDKEQNHENAPTPQNFGGTDESMWNRENLRRLQVNLHSEAPRTMLEMAASHPGEKIFFDDVCKKLNQTEGKTRAQMGVLTKIIRREWGAKAVKWPVDVQWTHEEQRMFYIMREATAHAWQDAKAL